MYFKFSNHWKYYHCSPNQLYNVFLVSSNFSSEKVDLEIWKQSTPTVLCTESIAQTSHLFLWQSKCFQAPATKEEVKIIGRQVKKRGHLKQRCEMTLLKWLSKKWRPWGSRHLHNFKKSLSAGKKAISKHLQILDSLSLLSTSSNFLLINCTFIHEYPFVINQLHFHFPTWDFNCSFCAAE